MNQPLPEYLVQGEVARLFPVLATTSKEGRTTSILLACLAKIDELGRDLLASAGQRIGARSKVETYTEVVPAKLPTDTKDRPDGLIVVSVGTREWRAFVEAKVAGAELDAEQIERYRQLARDNDLDCVITISNQFATTPTSHPLELVKKSRSKIPVIHWSWMYILTTADLLISRGDVSNIDQLMLLNELRRFLSHESAGVKGFDRMPREWTTLNQLVSSGGAISPKLAEARIVLEAWHQETRDLSLIMSRLTGTHVEQRLPRHHTADPSKRLNDEIAMLCDKKQLGVSLGVPDAAAPIEVVVDLSRRSVDVGMTLRAPEDKKSTKARLNWLLKQIKNDSIQDLHVRLSWPGRSAQTQHSVVDLRANIDLASEEKAQLSPTSFHLFESKLLGAKFTQLTNFISEVESIVPAFYGSFGLALSSWQKPAPTLKAGRDDAGDVSTGAIADESETFEPE